MYSKYQSELLGSLHETAAGLYKIGVITEAEMREYDRNCLAHEYEAASDAAPSRSQPLTPAFASKR